MYQKVDFENPLYTFILTYTFILFFKKIPDTHLFRTPRLFGTGEYLQMEFDIIVMVMLQFGLHLVDDEVVKSSKP